MNNSLYYPGFCVQDINWLKFALLFMETIQPVIPESGEVYLRTGNTPDVFAYEMVKNETNLINPYRPNFNEGYQATIYALEQIEKILRNPYRYRWFFGTTNVVNKWRDNLNQTYELYYEKFSPDWEKFCCSQGIGKMGQNGIMIDEDLAFIFMSILGHVIGEENQMPVLTDKPNAHNFSLFTRGIYPNNRQLARKADMANGVIHLQIPDLQQVSLKEIINLRNQIGFIDDLRAFCNEINKMTNAIENGLTPEEFIANQDWKAPILARIGTLGTHLYNIGVTFCVAATGTVQDHQAIAATLGGIAITSGGYYLRKDCQDAIAKRHCKKYLVNLYNMEKGARRARRFSHLTGRKF